MRFIGLHIRLHQSILEAMEYARKLGVPIFQCFVIDQIKKRPIKIDAQTAQLLHKQKQDFDLLFVHGSYFINLAHLKHNGYKSLKRELTLAKQIGAPYFILHPGSTNHTVTHEKGIAQLATVINKLIKEESDITFILENTAHGGNSIGSDLRDFKLLKELLDQPERLGFCIDTAHAHAYGYDICSPETQEQFIDLIHETVGLQNVILIHLNDSYHHRGTRIDKHHSPGMGTIGTSALKSFALNPRLLSIPLILELPVLPYEQEAAMIQQVRDWHIDQ